MTKPILTDKDGRTIIDGEIGYLAHSGPDYFCYGFGKNASEFWNTQCKEFIPRLERGYSFVVQPLLKGQTIPKVVKIRPTKVKSAIVTFVD